MPWTRVRSASARPTAQHRRPGHEAEVPAAAEQEEGEASARTPPSGGARARPARRRPAREARHAMTTGLPNRSVSRPVIGERPNMPNVWAESTRPTVARPWPWSMRWIGVIVMIRTITTCAATSVTSATATVGRRRSDRRRRGGPVRCRDASPGRTDRPGHTAPAGAGATASASDRPMKIAVSDERPGELGEADRRRQLHRPAPSRFGPMTAPIVVPHTTMPMAEARRSGRRHVGGDVPPEVAGRVREAGQKALTRRSSGIEDDETDAEDDGARRTPRPRGRSRRPDRRPTRSMRHRDQAGSDSGPDRRRLWSAGHRATPNRTCSAAASVPDRDRRDVAGAPERRRWRRGPSCMRCRSAGIVGRIAPRLPSTTATAPRLGAHRQRLERREVLGRAVGRKRDDRDVIGAGGVQRLDPVDRGVGGRAEVATIASTQPVAARRLPVGGVEALELPRGVVGRRAQVRLEVGARARLGRRRVATGSVTASTGRRSGAAASRRAAHPGDALRRHEVREGTIGLGGGEIGHPLAQGGDEDRRRLTAGRRPAVDRRTIRRRGTRACASAAGRRPGRGAWSSCADG